jgi:hypothetical protein
MLQPAHVATLHRICSRRRSSRVIYFLHAYYRHWPRLRIHPCPTPDSSTVGCGLLRCYYDLLLGRSLQRSWLAYHHCISCRRHRLADCWSSSCRRLCSALRLFMHGSCGSLSSCTFHDELGDLQLAELSYFTTRYRIT